MLGVDQPKISALTRGQLSGFSIKRLLRFLMLRGHDVEITVKSRSRSRARLLVAFAPAKQLLWLGCDLSYGFCTPISYCRAD